MSYDFSSQGEQFDFPNPYHAENIFFMAAAAILVVGGLMLLMLARGALGLHGGGAHLALVLGVALLAHGLWYGARALARLRFFFGRGRPRSLGDADLGNAQNGGAQGAEPLREMLRHNSLEFEEPSGPLNGALYALVPHLIFAPRYLQDVAQRQFQNAIAIGVTLLSLLVSAVGASHEALGWLGLLYFILAVVVLVKPLHEANATLRSGLGLWALLGLIVVAVLGPVVVPHLVRGVEVPAWVPGAGDAAFIMVAAEVSIGLFFMAVLGQTRREPPSAGMAVEQGTVTMNSHPGQVMDELERTLQTEWVAELPNRRYACRLPEVQLNVESGSFEGELLEETQPVPGAVVHALSLARCFAEPRYRWLAWLNVYGLVAMLVAVAALNGFAHHFVSDEAFDMSVLRLAVLGLAFWGLGKFNFAAGNYLWGRFDFISRLIWVEMKGNYQAARMDYGNQLTDHIKTSKNVINIESMTLRVWVAEIESVTFGKDGARFVVGMRGLVDEARRLHAHLADFASRQGGMLAPTAPGDVQRVEALGMLNRLHETAGNAVQERLQGQDAAAGLPLPTVMPTGPALCPVCGAVLQPGTRFCPQCGTHLKAA